MSRVWLASVLVVTAAGCSSPERPDMRAGDPVAVAVVPAAIHPVRGTVEAGGVVAARTTAALASRIAATVVSVEVRPGDKVRAGQRLLVLDGRDLEARRIRADASVVALEGAATASAADRDAADAALTLARAAHTRIAALHARRSATSQELDEAVAALQGAEARLRAADARIAGAGAALDSARAAAADTTVTASFAVLVAPFDGMITERLVDPGGFAAIGLPLLRIDDTRRFRLEVHLDELRAAGMAVGDRVEVAWIASGAAGPEATSAEGRVAEVGRAVEAGSHTFLVKVDLPPRPELRSGIFARARFDAGAREALMVPASAVVPQGQLSTVFVASPQSRARMRVVRTGVRDDTRTEVVAGLAPGDAVIVAPPPGLRDGDPVRTRTAVSGPAGGR